ncbi:hypothetical protein LINPERHAP2_LOCUS14881 [Linum perenne]
MSRKRKDDDAGESKRKYFPWTDELDQMLVRNMNTLVVNKKIDLKGKFNPGANEELERMMLVGKPTCGIKADPNIISLVKTLKSKFLAIHELRGLSGAGWDDACKRVDIDDTVYAEYVQVRATGKGAIGLEELNQVCPPIEEPQQFMFDWISPEECNVEHETVNEGDNPNDQSSPPTAATEPTPRPPTDKATQSEASSQPKRMRRSRSTNGSELLELKPILEDAVGSLRSMLVETDTVHEHRNKVYEELQKIDGLTAEQVMDATVSLGNNDRILQIFDMVDHDAPEFF